MQDDTTQSAQDDPAQPILEGRYALTGRAPIATFGPVELHTALDRQLERAVAVQLLPASASPDERARFLETQRVAAGIHHCGIVQVYDVGEWDGAAFSVLEKDAASRGGPPPAPDAQSALSAARQVAEALQCVRDAGLEQWTFSPAAIRTGDDATPRLALLDGLQYDPRYPGGLSARREDDARALATLLGMVIAGLPLAAVPSGIHDLIDRASTAEDTASLTAGQFAEELARLEVAARQPTEQYTERPAHAAAPTPYLASGDIDPHEAPTLAAPVVPAPTPAERPTTPYEGIAPAQQAHIAPREEPRRRVPLLPLAAAGLLLLALVLFVAWPRAGAPAEIAGNAASAAESTPAAQSTPAPTEAPTAIVVLAPQFLGKTLPEAKAQAQAAGLGLLVTSAAHDDQYPADTVARQDPAPGTPLSPGAEVSLVMSLGPEPAPAQVQPSEPPPPPAANDNGNKDNKDKKGDKDKGGGKKKP